MAQRADRAADIATAAIVTSLSAFVIRCFQTLNPGQEFMPAPHILALCHALEEVFEGTTKRLLVTMPPRHLKSEITSVAFVAWALGRDPRLRIAIDTVQMWLDHAPRPRLRKPSLKSSR